MPENALKKWNQLLMELKRVGKGLYGDDKLKKQVAEIEPILRRHADELGECEKSKTGFMSEGKGLHRMARGVVVEVDLVLKKLAKQYQVLVAKNKESNARYIEKVRAGEADPTGKDRPVEEINVGVNARKFKKAIKLLDAYRHLPELKNDLQLGGAKNAIAEAHQKWTKIVRNPVLAMQSVELNAYVIKGNAVEQRFKKLEGMSGAAHGLAKEVESHRQSLHRLSAEFQTKSAKLKTNLAAWAKKKKGDAHRQMQAKVVTGVINEIGKELKKADVAAEL